MYISYELDPDMQDLEKFVPELQRVATAVTLCFDLPEKLEVEVNFYQDVVMQCVNFETRGIDQVTDVLSYPYLELNEPGAVVIEDWIDDINPETNNLMLGNIALCLSRIEQQAKEFGHSFARELGYLFTHGLLHLLGYDHVKDSDRQLMRLKEEEVMSRLGLKREVDSFIELNSVTNPY